MDNTTIASPVPNSVTLPTDGPTNVWMYAVIAAATLFVIFLAVACYSLSEFFTKGPRPRRKDEEGDKAEGADNIDGMTAECNHLDMNGSRNVADVDSSVNTRSSVGALAWLRNVRVSPSPSAGCFRFFRRRSYNDDSREFREAHGTVMHDSARPRLNGDAEEMLHAPYCETNVDSARCCDDTSVRKQLWPDIGEGENGLHENNVETLNPVKKLSRKTEHSKQSYNMAPTRDNNNEPVDLISYSKAQSNKKVKGLTKSCPPPYTEMNTIPKMKKNTETKVIDDDSESDIEPSEQDHLIEENEKFIAPIAKKGTFAKEEEDVFHEYRGREPLQGRSTLPHRSRPPPIILLKSKSLEHEEAYESDDSIGNAESLRSQFSARSKMSRLSKLSVTSGPTIQIDPEEAVCKDALSPGRPVNIGFISYSSVDTEDSNAPESSASCDSDLSPRSLPSDTLSDLSPSNRKGTNGYGSDKVVKNVALDSLRMKSQMKQGGKRSDEDSGRDSLPNSLNNAQGKPEKTLIPRLDVHKVGKTSTNGRTGNREANQTPKTNGQVTKEKYQDIKSKRASLKKQNGNEVEFYDD
ncbi:uncharacterized protein LOC128236109 [Mya arenaria]|uniref:uncharacterized protein LOC128236109 n=1 Tax=Mya arenaria TaxID=6604 RepID=UPI0022E5E736|nr:uncharacterized protein LOC128236109 [Mya arenaria]